MEKMLEDLYNELQGLDKEKALEKLAEFAEFMYGEGFDDGKADSDEESELH